MKTPRLLPLLALSSILLALPEVPKVAARPLVPVKKVAPADRQKFDTTRFVPESELRNGQKGYALTVFRGTTIQRFGVEILGVLSKVNNGKDLILIRVTSGPSVSRQANIAAGMSGSPVYIGNRMVGAIAYSLPFAREPIGLVTPIGDMLEAWDPDLPAKPSMALAATAAAAIPTPGMSPAITVPISEIAPYLGRVASESPEAAGETTTFEPVMTPVMVSGMNPQGIARLATILAPLHLMPMAGGGPPSVVTAAERRDAKLIPGAAVGVSLVQGDIDETAIGTLTYRDGNRVVAFGHPFTGIGPIDAALTTATITDLFPSYQDSTKLGSPLETVGRIFQDRPFSVGGVIGSMPHMVPVTVTIHDESDDRTEYFHARVINHPLLTGSLITQVADQAILQTHGTPGDAIAMVTTDVSAEQVGHIVRTNIFYDPLSIDQTATGDLDNAMRLLSSNPFYPLAVKSVNMTVTIESKHPTAQIDHIILPKATYEPGDTVDVGVVLKPYRREPTMITVPLTIPTTAPDGPVTVQVRGGASAEGASISLGGGLVVIKPASPVGPPAANITQLVHQYLEEPRNNDLIVSLMLPSTAMDIQGDKFSLLPPTMSAVMRSEHSSGLKMERDEVKKTLSMDWIVSGQQALTINVARKDVTDQSGAASSSGPAAPSADSGAPPNADTADSDDSSDDSSDVSSADNSPDDGDGSASALPQQPKPMSFDDGLGGVDLQSASVVRHSSSPASVSPSMQTTSSSGVAPGAPAASATGTDATAAAKPTPVGRLATIWRQDTESEFQEGTLDNVTISSQNDLRLSASLSAASSAPVPYIWALAVDKGGDLFAGTGDDGVVYKMTGKKMTPYAHTGEIEVSSLAYDPKSNDLYAGTSPHGAVFRITPDGKSVKVFTADEKYITALALDPKAGLLYAATGGGVGKVYAIPLANPSSGKTLFSSPEAHLQSLAVGPDGQIYAGGAPDGLIYSIAPNGSGKILYDASESNISCLAVDDNGVVYAGTAPQGVIYKITPSATGGAPDVDKLTTGTNSAIYGLQVGPTGAVWACSGNNLLRIPKDGTILTYAAASDTSFICLALNEDGQVYAGTSNIGTIYVLGSSGTAPAAAGTFTSPVHDAKLPARWGTITWQAATPEGSSVQLETRSGDVDRPDSTWSSWSAPYTMASGETIASPPGRFIQYRAILAGNAMADPEALPRVQSVAIYYLTRNQAPSVKFLSPAGGDAVSGEVTLRWSGSDPDKDTLSYNLLYSTDNSKTWQPIKALQVSEQPGDLTTQLAGVAATLGAEGVSSPSDADVAKAMDKFKQQLDQHPEIPPTVRAQMLQQAPEVIRQAMELKPGQTTASAANTDDNARVTATSYKWDTKSVPDGTYLIKVVASNAPSNPTDALTAESVSSPFVVDNTPPTLAIDPARTSIDAQKRTAQLHGAATTKLSFVEAVQYRIDNSQDWYAAAPDGGLFDSRNVEFTITTPALTAGTHKITVQAINQAGNTAETSAQFVIP